MSNPDPGKSIPSEKIDTVIGVESRGFIFAAPLAYLLGAGFVPVRKPKKLPAEKVSVSYDLEYGQDTLEVHKDAVGEGHRVLIVDEKQKKILLSKEQRPELQDWDYRLPGGKVFDKLDQYLQHKDNEESFMKCVEDAIDKETKEEAGIIVKSKKFLHKSVAGASVIWDLYYYLIDDFSIAEHGQDTEKGEIIYPEWKSFDEVKEMCLNGKINEDRSVAVILRYILNE